MRVLLSFSVSNNISIAFSPKSFNGLSTVVIDGEDRCSKIGPPYEITEISFPISLFNSLQAFMAPTAVNSVEEIILVISGFFIIVFIIISLACLGFSDRKVL